MGGDFERAKADADAITLSTSVVKTPEDLILPTQTANGSVITWSNASGEIVVSNNQIVSLNRPSSANAAVTLTANVTKGEYTLKRSFAITVPAQPYKFDFGAGNVQSGFVAVNASTLYSEKTGYGFVGTAQSDMARAPGNVTSGYENLHDDQVMGEIQFKAEIPNGKYSVVIHYGSWNTGFGVNYTIEGVSSGNLTSTDASQHSTTVEVTDGMLDVSIEKGAKQYGGYISGMDVMPIESTPEPTATPTPIPTITPTSTPIPEQITYTDNIVTVRLENAENAVLIHAVYEEGKLISVDINPLEFVDGAATVLKEYINSGDKLMVWDNINGMNPLSEVYVKF